MEVLGSAERNLVYDDYGSRFDGAQRDVASLQGCQSAFGHVLAHRESCRRHMGFRTGVDAVAGEEPRLLGREERFSGPTLS